LSTSDRMQDVFPIVFDFKNGEQPSATKLTKWINLEDAALNRVTLAIGDPWDYQVHTTTEDEAYTLSPEKLAQVSLARIIGPSDYVSPIGGGLNEDTDDPYWIRLASGRNCYNLGFPLIKRLSVVAPDSGVAAIQNLSISTVTFFTAEDGNTPHPDFGTSKTNAFEMNEDGDYSIDYAGGIIYLYSVLSSTAYIKIEDLSMFGTGPQWAYQNVIPSWSEGTTAGVSITYVSSSGGSYTYRVDMPQIASAPGHASAEDSYGTVLRGDETYYVYHPGIAGIGSYYHLPYSITSTLGVSAGEIIPEGFCYLWNNVAGTIVALTEFEYVDEHTLNVVCPQLTGVDIVVPYETNTSGYRLLITGSSLAEQVAYLSSVVRDNHHVGLTDGAFVRKNLMYTPMLSHSALVDRFVSTDTTDTSGLFSFRESLYSTNCHPQYLHRSGYLGDDLEGNTGNAMRGDIGFSREDDYAFASGHTSVSGNYTSTYGLCFGWTSGSNLRFDGGYGIDTWTTSSAADRIVNPFNCFTTSGPSVLAFGALVHEPWEFSSFYLRGADSSSDYAGATLGFDFGRNSEANCIKLCEAIRDTDHEYSNSPAFVGQDANYYYVPLIITPELDYRLSPDQIREFRFRAASRNSSAINGADSLSADITGTIATTPSYAVSTFYSATQKILITTHCPYFQNGRNVTITGATNSANNGTFAISAEPAWVDATHILVTITNPSMVSETGSAAVCTVPAQEFDQYFISPAIAGADFFNVYSNAIFFSQQGDGKATSWHELGEDWMNGVDADQYPVGMYYIPQTTTEGGSYFQFSTRDTSGLGSSSTGAVLQVGAVYGIHGTTLGEIALASSFSSVSLTGYAGLEFVSAMGEVAITSTANAVTINAGKEFGTSFSLTSYNAISITSTVGGLEIATAYNIIMTSSIGTISLDGVQGVTISSSAQGITLDSHGHFALSGDYSIALTAGDDIVLTAADDITLTAPGQLILDAAAISFADIGVCPEDADKIEVSYVLCMEGNKVVKVLISSF